MYLGLDIGTSITKAALFDGHGRELAFVSRDTAVFSPHPGWFEFEGDIAWRAVVAVIKDLFSKNEFNVSDVRGIGVTAVMMGAWMLDSEGDLIRNPILWNDSRAQELVNRKCDHNSDLYAQIFKKSGSVMQLGCIVPLLAWLDEYEPTTIFGSSALLCTKDYIRFKLTGELSTDVSEAVIAPGGAESCSFHPEQLALLGVGHLAGLLPKVRASAAIGGYISRAAAGATGLSVGIPVAVGTGDVSACAIGAGCHDSGQAVSILGTTCLNGVVSRQPRFEPENLGLLFSLPGDRWMKTMVNVAGTTVLDWALSALCPDLLARPEPYVALGEMAAQSSPGANGLTFIPYLSAGGIIAPRIEPRARGSFTGLTPDHTRADLVRSIYEGLAYAIRDCYADIGGTAGIVRLVGGGAQSPLWCQMIADVTGDDIEIPAGTQFGAKGAALCSMVATGLYPSIGTACAETYQARRRHRPDPEVVPDYQRGFEAFKAACTAYLDGLDAPRHLKMA